MRVRTLMHVHTRMHVRVQVSRELGVEVMNFGFSGNGWLETAVGLGSRFRLGYHRTSSVAVEPYTEPNTVPATETDPSLSY